MSTQLKEQAKATGESKWTVDPTHAHLEFAVKHLMINTVRGKFTEVQGTVELDPADLTTAKVDVTIGAKSVNTGVDARDNHLRSADFFDAEQFPALTYRSRKVNKAGGEYQLVGDLTIHGITREVALTVTPEGAVKDPWGGERLGFSAVGKVNRKDFGLTWNVLLEGGGLTVGEDVKLNLEVELVKQN